jgi:hypothetical protein
MGRVMRAEARGRAVATLLGGVELRLTREEALVLARELLQAVSALEASPPRQHRPRRLEAIREKHGRAYVKWSPAEDSQLLVERAKGHGIAHLARSFGRTEGAISSRLQALGEAAGSQPTAARPPPAQERRGQG